MEFKGTPGPWYTSNEGRLLVRDDEWQCVIADGIGCNGDEEEVANARLIAASPELLSALQGIQQSMAKYINIANNIGMDVTADGFYLGHAMEVEEQARAAINKALGRI
ncbi:TPA: hypothetical protein ON737_001361 [Morganella morganii]|nr:hypothetical protein [Morganella morganii]HCR3760384.1 hypothetical protein [Morganella morganii]